MATSSRRRTVAVHSDDTLPIRTQPAASARLRRRERASIGELVSFPFLIAAIHFAIVQVAASLAFRYATSTDSSAPFKSQLGDPPSLTGWQHWIVEPLRNWDGLWYRLVAQDGYKDYLANAAFWPLYPMSMRALSRVTGLPEEVSGYLIANLCFAAALVVLYRLVNLDFDVAIARRTLWATALFPTSLFFTAVYTESLFLLLSVGALLAARTGRWWVAGALGVLAALTRSHGIFLVFPFAVLFIRQYGFYLRAFFPKAINVAAPLLGPVIFGWHLERVGHGWKAFIDVQNMWNRTRAWPWETMDCAVNGCTLKLTQYGQTKNWLVNGADWSWFDQLRTDRSWSLVTSEGFRRKVADSDTLELVATILFFVLVVIGLKVLPLYQSVYLIPGLAIPLFSPSTVHPLMSMPRFGLVLFPLFIVIAIVFRKRWLALPFAMLSAALLVLLTIQFANWYWVS
jgi:Mannosyltransferase (PIG-V)